MNGVIYVDAEDVVNFSTQLMNVLSVKRGVFDVVARWIMHEEAKAPVPDLKNEPLASWTLLRAPLQDAALAFQ